jgi:sugar lactone lactonase YvrE
MVRDNAPFYDPLGLVSQGVLVDFQVGVNSYLYGTRFISYLALQYSPQQVIAWLTRPEGSEAYYAHQFRQVFGMELDAAWAEWIDFEHEFQRANLAALREYPLTPYRDLTTRGLGSVSRAFVETATNTLYAGLRYPGVVAHLAALSLDNGDIRRLQDIKSPMLYHVTSLAFDANTRTLFYTSDNLAFRDLIALDLDSGKQRPLLKDARIGEIVLNPQDRSLWGMRHANGLATLVRIPEPYTEWQQVRTWKYGELMYDIDISPDGRLLSTSFSEVNGDQSLRVYALESMYDDEPDLVASQAFGSAAPEGFVFSPDGQDLYGSAYYTGVSNIYRFNIASGEFAAMSNAETGFFRPLPLDNGEMLVMRYSGDGFVPAIIEPQPLEDLNAITFLGAAIANKHTVVRDWRVPSPADVPLESIVTSDGDYKPLRELSLESLYPVLEGYKDTTAIGLHARITDPISLHNLDASASYSLNGDLPGSENLHANLLYEHLGFSVDLRHNYADFYDLFGPTKTSLKGDSVSLGYERTLIFDKPRRLDFETELSHYRGLDRVPYFQEIDTTFDELWAAQVSLNYENVRRSLGAVDDEKGWLWKFAAGGNHVNGENIPYMFGRLDAGFELPWKHSSVWLRNAAGVANGDSADPFANFFLGGFGNNWVDHREVKRYRDPFSMPGFEINEIGGQKFARGMLEWNLAPHYFHNAGSPGFFTAWMRPSLFTSVLVTRSDSVETTFRNVGLQVDFQLYVFSRLEMMLSVGAARGYSDDARGENEFMVSLKIL